MSSYQARYLSTGRVPDLIVYCDDGEVITDTVAKPGGFTQAYLMGVYVVRRAAQDSSIIPFLMWSSLLQEIATAGLLEEYWNVRAEYVPVTNEVELAGENMSREAALALVPSLKEMVKQYVAQGIPARATIIETASTYTAREPLIRQYNAYIYSNPEFMAGLQDAAEKCDLTLFLVQNV